MERNETNSTIWCLCVFSTVLFTKNSIQCTPLDSNYCCNLARSWNERVITVKPRTISTNTFMGAKPRGPICSFGELIFEPCYENSRRIKTVCVLYLVSQHAYHLKKITRFIHFKYILNCVGFTWIVSQSVLLGVEERVIAMPNKEAHCILSQFMPNLFLYKYFLIIVICHVHLTGLKFYCGEENSVHIENDLVRNYLTSVHNLWFKVNLVCWLFHIVYLDVVSCTVWDVHFI